MNDTDGQRRAAAGERLTRSLLSTNRVALALLLAAAGCTASPAPSPTGTTSPTVAPTPTLGTSASPRESPPPTPEPPLSLALPRDRDERQVRVAVSPEVAPDASGEIVVTVTNLAESRIDEIVLRWPTDVGATLMLAPFVPSDDRIREGGPPLVQEWTKWVEGPGERGEPAGTTSLGYGPMDPAMTLTIRLYATRNGPGPVHFDLQLLADEALLALEGGAPGELRVEVP